MAGAGNQGQEIAHNGSSHRATTTGPTDVCKLPNNVPTPFPNWIDAKGNVQNGTSCSLIQKQSVWIQKSNLGPTSDPAHAGVNKGVASGTYRGIAKATSWSKDVKMEGQFVVRTNDPTTQNNANTVGICAGSAKDVNFDNDAEYQKLLCFITEIKGECGHGRKLGPPPGVKNAKEDNYLEVLARDKITFESTRKDLITGAIDPTCHKGIHTHWIATRVSNSDLFGKGTTKEEKKTQKIYIMENPLKTVASQLGVTSSSEANNVNDYSRRNRMKIPANQQATGVPGLKTKDSTGRWAHNGAVTNKPRGKAATEQREMADRVGGKLTLLATVAKVAMYWDAAVNPPVITVEAWACSGSKSAQIKLLPSHKLELDFFTAAMRQRLEKVKKLANLVDRSAGVFGFPARIDFLPTPKVVFTCEYKELTKDTPARKAKFGIEVPPFYKVQTRKTWTLDVGLQPLVSAYIKFTTSIANLAGVVGAAAASALRRFGVKADFFWKLEVSVSLKGGVTWDEYDEFVGFGDAEIVLTFSAGIEISFRVGEVVLYGYLEGKVNLTRFGPRPGSLFAWELGANLQLGIKGHVMGKIAFIKKTVNVHWKPKWLGWSFGPTTLKMVPAPGSGGKGGP